MFVCESMKVNWWKRAKSFRLWYLRSKHTEYPGKRIKHRWNIF